MAHSHDRSAAKAEDHSGCKDHGHHKPSSDKPGKGSKYDKVPEGFRGTVYTCPMHPEVRQPKAGSCPLCGMGLEAETASAGDDDGPNMELVDFTRRFWVAAVLTIPLLILTMSPSLG